MLHLPCSPSWSPRQRGGTIELVATGRAWRHQGDSSTYSLLTIHHVPYPYLRHPLGFMGLSAVSRLLRHEPMIIRRMQRKLSLILSSLPVEVYTMYMVIVVILQLVILLCRKAGEGQPCASQLVCSQRKTCAAVVLMARTETDFPTSGTRRRATGLCVFECAVRMSSVRNYFSEDMRSDPSQPYL